MKLATFYTEFSKRKIDMCGEDFFFNMKSNKLCKNQKFEEKLFRTRNKKKNWEHKKEDSLLEVFLKSFRKINTIIPLNWHTYENQIPILHTAVVIVI